MGGMAFGSWAPAATECYQEALRLPPVRLFKAGVEQRDIWAIVRNNIRVSHLVEMTFAAWWRAAKWLTTRWRRCRHEWCTALH